MRILVLSQHFWPESFRINEVVESLRRAGCEVSVLTGQPNYPDGDVFTGYKAFRTRRELHPNGYWIYRVPLVPRGRGTALRLIGNYLSFLTSACLLGPWLLRHERFDVIFVYGTSPILQAIAGIVLKWIKGAALVTWVQDLWPQSLQVTGFVQDQRVLNAVAAVVRWMYARNDLLLAQSTSFVSSIQPMAGTTPVRYHPNPGDEAFADQGPREAELVLPRGFNVVFAGNLGTVQALDTLLDAAELLRGHADVRLVLIGSGSRGEWVRQEVGRRQLNNVMLPGRFHPSAMPAILAQASVCVVSLVRDPIMTQTVPAKIQAYLAAGKPIVASLDGEGARVVTEAAAGIACPAEDAPALAQAIVSLHSSLEQTLVNMGRNGRDYYAQHFEPGELARQLIRDFELLAGKPSPAETRDTQAIDS